MDHKKADQLQLLLDLTTEHINEISLTLDMNHMTALAIFEEAVSLAIIQYQFVTKNTTKRISVGKVDTNSVAFNLHDKDTVVVLQGDVTFAEMIDLDYVGVEDDDDSE